MDEGSPLDRYVKLRSMIIILVGILAIAFMLVYLFVLSQEKAAQAAVHYPPPAQNITNATANMSICGDDCFIGVAVSTSDSSYCRNVSAAKSDECWGIFSSSELSSCLMLRNYSMEKGCIEDFAIAQKNLSLCGLLKGSDVALCKDKVTPPCLDISDKSKRDLCLALRNNNTAYCSEEACLLEYAKQRMDSAACDNLTNAGEKYACRGYVSGTDECSLVTGAALDYCYGLLAGYSGNFDYCKKISYSDYRYGCYTDAAVSKGSMAYCLYVDDEHRSQCYKNYSLKTHDVKGCLQISDIQESSKDGCLQAYAIAFNEPGACQYLSTVYFRTNCYANAIWMATNLDVTKCYAVPHTAWRDKCFTQLAVSSGQASTCAYIEDPDEKSNCENSASAAGNTSK